VIGRRVSTYLSHLQYRRSSHKRVTYIHKRVTMHGVQIEGKLNQKYSMIGLLPQKKLAFVQAPIGHVVFP